MVDSAPIKLGQHTVTSWTHISSSCCGHCVFSIS